ncbi:MAG: DUF3365 domain-containing protein [FCB group bacterium]|nr:DUF3365 domain-containing protein [FCB group bacterium]
MKRVIIAGIIILALTGCIKRVEEKSETFDDKKAIAACEQVIAEYQQALKRELVSAMTSGGPVGAIAVCNVAAPAIADSFNARPGLDIKRISLKQRNIHFAPDSLEVAVLEFFNSTVEIEPLTYSNLFTDSAGVIRFRYLKEIKVGQLCLKCHGNPEGFSSGLNAALAEKYPQDKAVGYNVGDSRGAFSVTLTFPEAEATITELLSENGR